mgnify:CR=1 FL=1
MSLVSIDGMESDYSSSSSDEEMLEGNGVNLRAAIQLDDVGYFKQHFHIRKTDNEFKTLIVEHGGNIYRHFSSYLRGHRSLLCYMIQTDRVEAMKKLLRSGYSDILDVALKVKIVQKNGLIYRNLLRRTLYHDSELVSHLVRHDMGDCFFIMNVRFMDLEPRLQMTVRVHRDTKLFDYFVFTRELTREGVVNIKPKDPIGFKF